jgi:hypothetical protein
VEAVGHHLPAASCVQRATLRTATRLACAKVRRVVQRAASFPYLPCERRQQTADLEITIEGLEILTGAECLFDPGAARDDCHYSALADLLNFTNSKLPM